MRLKELIDFDKQNEIIKRIENYKGYNKFILDLQQRIFRGFWLSYRQFVAAANNLKIELNDKPAVSEVYSNTFGF